ncbi:MAG TPA: VOC family protein [Acidimicrobiales bacterium]
MRPQPLVALEDVEAGSRWFQTVLGLRSGHGGSEYEMLLADGGDGGGGGEMVLQLHQWEADEHQHLGDRSDPSRGNGILLWFATDDFDAAMERVTSGGAVILEGPLHNPNADHREVWLQGPENYVVVVAGK